MKMLVKSSILHKFIYKKQTIGGAVANQLHLQNIQEKNFVSLKVDVCYLDTYLVGYETRN